VAAANVSRYFFIDDNKKIELCYFWLKSVFDKNMINLWLLIFELSTIEYLDRFQ